MEVVRVFSRVRRHARAWMKAPEREAFDRMATSAREATALVPEARRDDWTKLVEGFGAAEPDVRRQARVAGLERACALFLREQREQRAAERRLRPIAWTEPAEHAEGVGPAGRQKLAAHGIRFAADLAWTLPVGWDDLRAPMGVAEAAEVAEAAQRTLAPAPRLCVLGVVQAVSRLTMRGRPAVRLVLADVPGRAALDAWWFYMAQGVLATARPGAACILTGRLRARGAGRRPTMAHPDLARDEPSARVLRPRYASLGVPPGTLRRAVHDVVTRMSPLPDPVPAEVVRREAMPDVERLREVHAVRGPARDPAAPANGAGEPGDGGGTAVPEEALRAMAERLAWAEAFTRVWQRHLSEDQWQGARAPALADAAGAVSRVVAAFGFALTRGQERAIGAVSADLASATPMRRLLVGDVGTGKTAVALAAAAQCAAAGHQCALLVPTAILVDQYVAAAAPLARVLGVQVERVMAGMAVADRRRVLAALASGAAPVVVGTHALLDEGVEFARLGLVVVDEQHRLGVAQRLALVRKARGVRPHLLSLSATPIPRTLALALRGELATSVLEERPRGRLAATTELRSRAELEAVVEVMRAAVGRGERVFFVCPRIDDDLDEERL
ncbi:MAG: DEAD/DEAH box helicase, partial [Myxococcales bacterium]|nr:DEAD/DEAH box helicase [Myxococcales bacterium]